MKATRDDLKDINDDMKHNKNCLTRVQEETLLCIEKLIRGKGISPTYQEIADSLGISTNAVSDRIKWIALKGYCTHNRKSPRSIRLIDPKARCAVQAGG